MPDKVGKQELEIVLGNDHICFVVSFLSSIYYYNPTLQFFYFSFNFFNYLNLFRNYLNNNEINSIL